MTSGPLSVLPRFGFSSCPQLDSSSENPSATNTHAPERGPTALGKLPNFSKSHLYKTMPTRAQSYRLRQIHATLERVYDELIRLCAFLSVVYISLTQRNVEALEKLNLGEDGTDRCAGMTSIMLLT
jgi:hypothetical protein